MSVYRIRISDEIYDLLRAEALASGASLERLVEACVLDGIARRRPVEAAASGDGVPLGSRARP